MIFSDIFVLGLVNLTNENALNWKKSLYKTTVSYQCRYKNNNNITFTIYPDSYKIKMQNREVFYNKNKESVMSLLENAIQRNITNLAKENLKNHRIVETNTVEDYIQKIIDLTNSNKLIWKKAIPEHTVFGWEYESIYKNTPIRFVHGYAQGESWYVLNINNTTYKRHNYNILNKLRAMIIRQLENKENENILDALSIFNE